MTIWEHSKKLYEQNDDRLSPLEVYDDACRLLFIEEFDRIDIVVQKLSHEVNEQLFADFMGWGCHSDIIFI